MTAATAGMITLVLLWICGPTILTVGTFATIYFVGRAKKRKARRPPQPAPKPAPKPAPPAPKPSPDYIRRWSNDRRYREEQEKIRFEQLLNEQAAPPAPRMPQPEKSKAEPAAAPRDPFKDLREKLANL
jgi:type IV secretory pathway VirB10-like protein